MAGHGSRDEAAEYGCSVENEVYIQVKVGDGEWVWGGREDETPLPVHPVSGRELLSRTKFPRGKDQHNLQSLRDQEGEGVRVRVMSKATWEAGRRGEDDWTELQWLGEIKRRGKGGAGKLGRWNLKEVVEGLKGGGGACEGMGGNHSRHRA